MTLLDLPTVSTETPAEDAPPATEAQAPDIAGETAAELTGSRDEPLPEPAGRPNAIAGALTTDRRTSVTFYLSETLRNRARAAYRSTSFEERDSSWSEMLNKALIAEVERREAEYNRGEEYAASDAPLTPGRPIGY
ncbi:ParB family protein [Leifsonia shinshuensis]|uniref:Centromere-binding protein ParB C-terminal domain-containing protein n=1 Tax=Leifsonia shinshuensis TaxID=150026 RepID=A0A853CMT5_9MICO|nr:hypothetical protein [Leifsonia shinshuensis]